MNNNAVTTANLLWDEQGQPWSVDYNDVYFSKDSGLEESRYVFLDHNKLSERFAGLADDGIFTIGETGFGSGTNFLCAWHLFLQQAPANARLHFISVEKFPMTGPDLRKVLAHWPEFAQLTEQLCQHYPDPVPGFHRRSFCSGRVQLTLIIDEASQGLAAADVSVDAWFLDGFAPARNPDMWSPELFTAIAAKSSPQATFATFTSAGHVRRSLQDKGFDVCKVPGFGHKREMLCGQRTPDVDSDIPETVQSGQQQRPWLHKYPNPNARQALIIGAGIAGAASARSLAERGWQVTVIDRAGEPASGASGNPQGMLYTRLSAHNTELTQLVAQGYRHTINQLKNLPPADFFSLCGLVQLPDTDKEAQRQRQLVETGRYAAFLEAKSAKELSEIAGTEITKDGLFFYDGGWIHPPSYVAHLLDHQHIRFLGRQSVTNLQQQENNNWLITTSTGQTFTSPVVIIACGHQAQAFQQTSHLPLKSIRGQVTKVPSDEHGGHLKTVVCEEGYVAPATQGFHTLGATFHFHDPETACRAADHTANLETIEQFARALSKTLRFRSLNPEQLAGRAGFRCTSPDYMPVVGPVLDASLFKQRFAALEKNARKTVVADVPWLKGLFVNTGHGSRGLITAPLAGEILASHITGEPAPVSEQLMHCLHPARFPARELIKGAKAKPLNRKSEQAKGRIVGEPAKP